MTNPLLEPTSDVRAGLGYAIPYKTLARIDPACGADWVGPKWDAWMRATIASGTIVPPIGERSQVRVWPWALIGLACIVGAFAYGALAR